MINIWRHENGHHMGLGHRPIAVTDPSRNTMSQNAGLTTVFGFMTDHKAQLTAYAP